MRCFCVSWFIICVVLFLCFCVAVFECLSVCMGRMSLFPCFSLFLSGLRYVCVLVAVLFHYHGADCLMFACLFACLLVCLLPCLISFLLASLIASLLDCLVIPYIHAYTCIMCTYIQACLYMFVSCHIYTSKESPPTASR